MQLGQEKIEHTRTSYNIISIMGEVGGFSGLIISIFAVIIAPFQEFTFTLRILKKLYMAKTVRDDLFIEKVHK